MKKLSTLLSKIVTEGTEAGHSEYAVNLANKLLTSGEGTIEEINYFHTNY